MTPTPDMVNTVTAEVSVDRNVAWESGPASDGTDPHLIPMPDDAEPDAGASAPPQTQQGCAPSSRSRTTGPLEAARGRRDQIPHLWRQLRARYADDADETAGWVATPTPETELAFEMLMTNE